MISSLFWSLPEESISQWLNGDANHSVLTFRCHIKENRRHHRTQAPHRFSLGNLSYLVMPFLLRDILWGKSSSSITVSMKRYLHESEPEAELSALPPRCRWESFYCRQCRQYSVDSVDSVDLDNMCHFYVDIMSKVVAICCHEIKVRSCEVLARGVQEFVKISGSGGGRRYSSAYYRNTKCLKLSVFYTSQEFTASCRNIRSAVIYHKKCRGRIADQPNMKPWNKRLEHGTLAVGHHSRIF